MNTKNIHDTQPESRDQLLDFAKGLAIVLVVTGHTLQGLFKDFDAHWAFRTIYSFHMPLFAMLAGASAAFWINQFDLSKPPKELALTTLKRIQKAAEYLLVPFLSWSLISFINANQQETIKEYAWKLLRYPDYSLWFLPCIFWCTTYAATALIPIAILKKAAISYNLKWIHRGMESSTTIAILMLFIWKLASQKLPPYAGLVFANSFHGGLFFFFLLGISLFHVFSRTESKLARILPYIIFIYLAPYWHRTLPNNLMGQAPIALASSWFTKYFAIITATAGCLVAIDISRITASLQSKILNNSISKLGQASLGIYAIHFYFLSYQPMVVAPIIVSVLFWQLSSYMPAVRRLLFGK